MVLQKGNGNGMVGYLLKCSRQYPSLAPNFIITTTQTQQNIYAHAYLNNMNNHDKTYLKLSYLKTFPNYIIHVNVRTCYSPSTLKNLNKFCTKVKSWLFHKKGLYHNTRQGFCRQASRGLSLPIKKLQQQRGRKF